MLESVQALRGLAALCVVIYHADFIGRGAFGVDIFFVISGFIICHVTAEDHSGFLRKRLIRIVPLYWAGTLGVYLLALLAPRLLQTTSDSVGGLLQSLLFIPYAKDSGRVYPVLFLGWTLNYEMLFYMLFAAALAMHRRMAPVLVCTALVTLVALGAALRPSSVIGRFYTAPILLEFGYGMVVFYLWGTVRDALRDANRFLVLAACCVLILAMGAIHVEDSGWRFLAWGAPAALLVLLALAVQGRIAFPLAVVALGDASYSLYLFHPYVLKAVEKTVNPLASLSPGTFAAALLYLALSLLLARLVYRYFERPVIALLRARLLERGAAAAAPLATARAGR